MSTVSSKHDDTAVPKHAALRRKRFVVKRDVQHRLGKIGAQRPANLDGPYRAAGRGAAAPVFDQLAKCPAEFDLNETAAFDVAGELECKRTPGPLNPTPA